MKKYLPFIGIIWLVALACFIWGAAMVYYDIFPSRLLTPPLQANCRVLEGTPGR